MEIVLGKNKHGLCNVVVFGATAFYKVLVGKILFQ